jgi:3-dehydroquinate synthase
LVVELGERSYPVYVGAGLLERVGPLIREALPSAGKCVVITCETVHDLHGETLEGSLEEAGINGGVILVPDGEAAKSWAVAEQLIGELLLKGLDRQSALVAFGGGAIGDLSGFVASIYLRGVRLVQVPTTLLSQVDSSLGGKAAVNHPMGKNLIGSFHQPSLVVSDPGLLSTLPRRELLSGLGEVVKHGVIADGDLFDYVGEHGEGMLDADPDHLSHAVRRSVAIKGRLVALDERDAKGIRAALNYGHTMGHAVEALSGMEVRHGEAVALGMVAAARISEELRLMAKDDAGRQRWLLGRLGFDLKPPSLEVSELLRVMRKDKKVKGGSIRFVLPTGIGSPPVIRTVPESLISQILEEEGYG